MFWNILDRHRLIVLRKLSASNSISDCYLAGGTGLALQLGHRLSLDFDWFSPTPIVPGQLERILGTQGDLKILTMRSGTFHAIFDGVRVSWLHYPSSLVKPLIPVNRFQLQVASLEDIGTMKLVAVSQRGAKRDFVDLYALEEHGVSVINLLDNLAVKFPKTHINYYHVVKSLNFFDDADPQPMPHLLKPLDWNEIKDFFRSQQSSFLKAIMEK